MRRASPAAALAVAVALLVTPVGVASAQPRQAVYVGGGHGVEVLFELKGRKLVRARIAVNLGCITHKRGHTWTHRVRRVTAWASVYFPLRVDADDTFREGFADQEEWIGEEAPGVGRIKGQIGTRGLVGTIAIYGTAGNEPEARHPWSETCQTGPLPPGRMRELTFRAHRR